MPDLSTINLMGVLNVRISFSNTMTAIVAAAAVLGVASVADARPELVMLKGVMVNGKMVSKHITPAKRLGAASHSYTYTFSASVPLHTKTIVTGWALIDQSTCTEITAGRMKEKGKLEVLHGDWSTGKYVETGYTCSNGGTITATFGSVFFSWSSKKSAVGTIQKGTAIWHANGGSGIGTYKITNHDRAVYSG